MHSLLACRSDPVVGKGEPGLNRLDKEDTAEGCCKETLNPHLNENFKLNSKQIVCFFHVHTLMIFILM